MVTQGNFSVEEYFLKVKNLCSEISELDAEEPVSEARLRRYLIRGLRKEFMPFVSSIQGWANQPTVIELENLLSNQEALIKQMTSSNEFSPKLEGVLYVKDQRRQNFHSRPSSSNENQFRSDESSKKPFKACYRCGKPGHFKRDCQAKVVCDHCGKPGHIKPNCRVKMQESEANAVHENKSSPDPIWEYCLTTEVLDQPTNVTSAVYQDDVYTGDQNSNSTTYASEFDSLQISHLDSLFFFNFNSIAPDDPSVYSTALDLRFDENEVVELTFDDLDGLYLPSEADDFLILENLDQTTNSQDSATDAPPQLDPEIAALLDDDDLSRFGFDVEDLEEDFVVQVNLCEEGEDGSTDNKFSVAKDFESATGS